MPSRKITVDAGWLTGTPRGAAELRAIVHDRTRAPEERFEATLMLAKLPRNSAKVRVRNRCALTGRPRGFHRKFGMSRIALRDLGSQGQIPGLVKASW